MLVFPNAKINLGLSITGKRPDGYHNIESVFYPVPLTDVLEVTKKSSDWNLKESGLPVGGDPDKNLCLKAARIFEERFGIPSTTIHLHKVIPMGAGLGGGSSDAAFTLIALNEVNGVPAGKRELFDMAMEIGSDCGFFIMNTPCFVKGRGELVRPFDLDLSGFHIAIIKSDIHVSTAEAYSMITPAPPKENLADTLKLPVSEWKGRVTNDFEDPIAKKFPVIRKIKDELYEQGAVYASMSGSGSAVFGLFKKNISLQDVFPEHFVWCGSL